MVQKRKIKKGVVLAGKTSIKEVMCSIDNTGLRSAYIVDDQGKLAGVVSDSEIRKSILKGIDIKSPVRTIINETPIVLREKDIADRQKVKKTINRLWEKMPDLDSILVVDENGVPIRLVSCTRLMEYGKVRMGTRRHSDKNVLVVGGAGYLGSVLAYKLLKQGFRVRVLDNLTFGRQSLKPVMDHKRFELIKGDMRNISILVKALDNMDVVVNLAAVVGDPACKNQPESAIETNYLANKVLAEACKYHQINRFLYASTCSVYGAAKGKNKLDENAPLNPVSLYARSKIQSEIGILELEDENFAPTILRMSTLYGYSPRMRFDLVVNTMTKTAMREKAIHVHNGGLQWRPLLHVDDAAEAYIKCIKAPVSKIKGAIFNVGSTEQNFRIIDIAEAVKKCVPKAELDVGASTTDQRDYSVSFERIEKTLKYKAKYNLEKAIIEIRDAIRTKKITNLNHPKYYNVENNT